MTYFYANYEYLCKKHGESLYKVAEKCGVTSSGTLSYWRKGAQPNASTLQKICDYFSCTPEQILTSDMAAMDAAAVKAPVTDDPLYNTIVALSPSKRALVAAFIAGIIANPDNLL